MRERVVKDIDTYIGTSAIPLPASRRV